MAVCAHDVEVRIDFELELEVGFCSQNQLATHIEDIRELLGRAICQANPESLVANILHVKLYDSRLGQQRRGGHRDQVCTAQCSTNLGDTKVLDCRVLFVVCYNETLGWFLSNPIYLH